MRLRWLATTVAVLAALPIQLAGAAGEDGQRSTNEVISQVYDNLYSLRAAQERRFTSSGKPISIGLSDGRQSAKIVAGAIDYLQGWDRLPLSACIQAWQRDAGFTPDVVELRTRVTREIAALEKEWLPEAISWLRPSNAPKRRSNGREGRASWIALAAGNLSCALPRGSQFQQRCDALVGKACTVQVEDKIAIANEWFEPARNGLDFLERHVIAPLAVAQQGQQEEFWLRACQRFKDLRTQFSDVGAYSLRITDAIRAAIQHLAPFADMPPDQQLVDPAVLDQAKARYSELVRAWQRAGEIEHQLNRLSAKMK